MIKNLKIPEERVPVLKAFIKKLESETGVHVFVEECSVKIEGDPIDAWKSKDVIRAVGRGFNPDKAMELLDDENNLYVINIKEYQNKEKGIRRIKSRIIGREGKTKKKLEDLGGCAISIYGKTVSIIGQSEKTSYVKEAIEMLINGSKHNKVYNYLLRCLND